MDKSAILIWLLPVFFFYLENPIVSEQEIFLVLLEMLLGHHKCGRVLKMAGGIYYDYIFLCEPWSMNGHNEIFLDQFFSLNTFTFKIF